MNYLTNKFEVGHLVTVQFTGDKAKEQHLAMPSIGYGTWMRRGYSGRQCIEWALELGYRHIDTAQGYENEAMCGVAIENSKIARREIYVTTKIKPQNLGPDLLIPTLQESLARLRTDYVDMTLIHWPSPNDEFSLESYIEDLAEAKRDGLTRNIGLSNFTIAMINQVEKILGVGQINTLQVEMHVYHKNQKIVDLCRSKNIKLTAFSPLALGRVADDPILKQIGSAYDAAASQIALSYLLQSGFTIIPTSSKKTRMKENLDTLKIQLTNPDMERIGTLNKDLRLLSPVHAPIWD